MKNARNKRFEALLNDGAISQNEELREVVKLCKEIIEEGKQGLWSQVGKAIHDGFINQSREDKAFTMFIVIPFFGTILFLILPLILAAHVWMFWPQPSGYHVEHHCVVETVHWGLDKEICFKSPQEAVLYKTILEGIENGSMVYADLHRYLPLGILSPGFNKEGSEPTEGNNPSPGDHSTGDGTEEYNSSNPKDTD